MHAILVLLTLLPSLTTAGADIFAAVRADDAAAVSAALDGGASLNGRGQGGQTPLMASVLQGKVNAVRVLLAAGADVTIPEKDGYTPMHGAGFQGRAAIAKLLIAHGLDPSDTHKDGYNALHRACWGREARHTETARVLLEAGVEPIEPGRCGASETNQILSDWFQAGGDPRKPTSEEL